MHLVLISHIKRIKLGFALVVAATAVLLGCDFIPSQTNDAKATVKSYLIDPDSAKFSEVEKGKSNSVCGYVNSKNRMGGYVGKTPFIYNTVIHTVDLYLPANEQLFRRMHWEGKTRTNSNESIAAAIKGCGFPTKWSEECNGVLVNENDKQLCDALNAGDPNKFWKLVIRRFN